MASKLETPPDQVDSDERKGAGEPGQSGDKPPNDANTEDNHCFIELQARPPDCVQRRGCVYCKRRLFIGHSVVQFLNVAVPQRGVGQVYGTMRGVAPQRQNAGARREVGDALTPASAAAMVGAQWAQGVVQTLTISYSSLSNMTP